MDRKPNSNHALSLIELLIVIVLIASLTGLLLPAISSVRQQAREARDLSVARSHLTIFNVYALDFKDCYPFLTVPGPGWSVVTGGGETVLLDFWDSFTFWPWALADRYYDGMLYHASFAIGRSLPGPITELNYSCSLKASPSYWNPSTRLDGWSQVGPVRQADVLWPSSKGVLLFFNERSVWQVSCADGSGLVVPANRLARGYPSGDGYWSVRPFHSYRSPLHTIDGARGRDILP